MRKKFVFPLLVTLLISSTGFANEVKEVKSYTLEVPSQYFVKYTGAFQNNFPKGFEPGHGSAIALKKINTDGSIEFYGLSDRGPNADGPIIANSSNPSGKIFPSPNFTPEIAVIKVIGSKAIITKTIPLKTNSGERINGLPVPEGMTGATGETPLDDSLTVLPYNSDGMDPEGIAIDNQGNFWISDEYGPFIAQFSPEGKLLNKLMPGKGLPELLKHRIPNRGMEGLTITPDGKYLWGAIQSVLDIDGKTSKTAKFTRLIRLDIATGKAKIFAYPINEDYKNSSGAKIGDIYALNSTDLLIIEQGADRDGNMQNRIYKISTTQATDITDKRIAGQELEFSNEMSSIQMTSKEMLIDLRQHGWSIEKAEGITLLPDRKTIVIVNDNDFGLDLKIKDENLTKDKFTNYQYNPKSKEMTKNGKIAEPKVNLTPNAPEEAHGQIWFIEMKESL
ncbi:MAG: esterase-like activity of phytase family protein [Negativicutes bacterium]|nr:esterase-like activity of phytase family protein [Negativicutes bacterium]